MKPLDLDGKINGRESRGLICAVCGKVIEQGRSHTCLTEEQLAWLADTEGAMDEIQRRIDAGEEIDMHGWNSKNWKDKITPA